jgi:hypothetical protein
MFIGHVFDNDTVNEVIAVLDGRGPYYRRESLTLSGGSRKGSGTNEDLDEVSWDKLINSLQNTTHLITDITINWRRAPPEDSDSTLMSLSIAVGQLKGLKTLCWESTKCCDGRSPDCLKGLTHILAYSRSITDLVIKKVCFDGKSQQFQELVQVFNDHPTLTRVDFRDDCHFVADKNTESHINLLIRALRSMQELAYLHIPITFVPERLPLSTTIELASLVRHPALCSLGLNQQSLLACVEAISGHEKLNLLSVSTKMDKETCRGLEYIVSNNKTLRELFLEIHPNDCESGDTGLDDPSSTLIEALCRNKTLQVLSFHFCSGHFFSESIEQKLVWLARNSKSLRKMLFSGGKGFACPENQLMIQHNLDWKISTESFSPKFKKEAEEDFDDFAGLFSASKADSMLGSHLFRPGWEKSIDSLEDCSGKGGMNSNLDARTQSSLSTTPGYDHPCRLLSRKVSYDSDVEDSQRCHYY